MFLYGYHPVREALRHRPHEVVRVLVSAARTGRRREEIAEACERHRVPFEVVPEGALLRVCEGAGVGRVLIRDRGSAPVTPTVTKTSAGATEWLAVERITNSGLELDRLKKAGYWVYGTDAGGEPPWEVDLTGPVVICLGGEEKGLRARTRQI